MIRIVQLYPRDMNLYGDWGNARVLQKRLEWRGIDAEIVDHNPGDETDLGSGDIFLGGGGQDAGQDKIQEDLQHHIDELGHLVEDDTPMLRHGKNTGKVDNKTRVAMCVFGTAVLSK